MTEILGIVAFFHDSATCLVHDGTIVAAAQEERFTRKKQDARVPCYAVRYCLQKPVDSASGGRCGRSVGSGPGGMASL